MSELYKAFDAEAVYFITFTLIERIQLFTIQEFAAILVDLLKYCVRNKGLSIYGYSILPRDVHLIVQSHKNPLGLIFRDLKKFTSSEII
jgi:REP element-mobilizing transposase RayT